MPFENLKTPDNFARLKRALGILDGIIPDCEIAGRCRADVSGRRDSAENMRDAITQMEHELFPDGQPVTSFHDT